MAAHLAMQLASTNRLNVCNFNGHCSTLPPHMRAVCILLYLAIGFSSLLKVVYVISLGRLKLVTNVGITVTLDQVRNVNVCEWMVLHECV